MLHNMVIGLLVHEALQWAEAAHRQQLYITCIALAALLLMATRIDQTPPEVAIHRHEVNKPASVRQNMTRCVPAGHGQKSVRACVWGMLQCYGPLQYASLTSESL